MSFGSFGPFLLLAMAWSFLWKGLALWRSAKRSDMWWFIAFLFINTFGILEIIYLFAITGAKGGAGLFFGFFNSQQPGGSGRPIGSLGMDMDFESKGGRIAARLITGATLYVDGGYHIMD